MVDQVLNRRPGPRSGPRVCRPGRGIVDQGPRICSTRVESFRPGPRLHRPVEESSTRTMNGRLKILSGVEIVDQVRGVVEGLSTRTRTRRPVPEDLVDQGLKSSDQVREFIDRVRGNSSPRTLNGSMSEEWVEGLSTRTRNRRPGPRICRPGLEIVDQVRDFIDRVRGIVDQDDEWSMKIYRVRGMVDQGLKSSTRSEEWSRVCRPGRGIVDRVRGFVDQGLKSSTRIRRPGPRSGRGFVDQDEESSTGSEDLSTRA
ncbi:unnamed protein product [Arabidopsis thaliana]|uniref:Uncharacterized protein n=1 Tax=Arabidopsis thaliana TaxID=3702 RepID=A0A654E7S6_ARATH|nr:unnamed protein product [Arabidopsis thaliana]